MQGAYKKFNQELFDETDAMVRAAVTRHVELVSGLMCQDNDDKYGPDLVIYKSGAPTYYLEVEQKRVWRSPDPKELGKGRSNFPWASVQLPERKAKFCRMELPLEFWILREDLAAAVVIPDWLVLQSPLVEVPNKYIQSGERFFQIPIDQCIYVELQGLYA